MVLENTIFLWTPLKNFLDLLTLTNFYAFALKERLANLYAESVKKKQMITVNLLYPSQRLLLMYFGFVLVFFVSDFFVRERDIEREREREIDQRMSVLLSVIAFYGERGRNEVHLSNYGKFVCLFFFLGIISFKIFYQQYHLE